MTGCESAALGVVNASESATAWWKSGGDDGRRLGDGQIEKKLGTDTES
jgi:hypothetical protein